MTYIYTFWELIVWEIYRDILKDESSPRESIAFKATDTSEANEVEQNDNIARKVLLINLVLYQFNVMRVLCRSFLPCSSISILSLC